MALRGRRPIVYLFCWVTIFYIFSQLISREHISNEVEKRSIQLREMDFKSTNGTILYLITPTYPRPEMLAEITRLSQTLMHVPDIVWIVAEDAMNSTSILVDFLETLPFQTVYLKGKDIVRMILIIFKTRISCLVVKMPDRFLKKKKKKPNGVENRNAGLEWVREYGLNNGVLYFADDDNTYDLRIFEDVS